MDADEVCVLSGIQDDQSTIQLFEKQDHYLSFGCSAIKLAKHYFKSPTALSTTNLEGQSVKSCCIKKSALESVLHFILNRMLCRVEIWSETKQLKKKLLCIASPGNIGEIEEYLATMNLDSTDIHSFYGDGDILSFCAKTDDTAKGHRHGTIVDVCIFNESEQIFKVSRLYDDESFIKLEHLIVQHCIKEIVYTCDPYFYSRVREMLKPFASSSLIEEVRKKSFADCYDGENCALASILSSHSLSLLKIDDSIVRNAIIPIRLICDKNKLLTSCSSNCYEIESLNTELFVKLDTAAVNALNLVDDTQIDNNNVNLVPSLHRILNKCKTHQGSRLLRRWIIQPLTNLKEIELRLEAVQHFVNNLDLANAVHNTISKSCDTDKVSRKLQRKNANLQICYKVYYLCKAVCCRIIKLLESTSPVIDSYFVEPIQKLLIDLNDVFIPMFEKIFDFDHLSSSGEFLVKASYNHVLARIKKELDVTQSQIENAYEEVRQKLNTQNVRLERSKMYGYHFRITLKYANSLTQKEFFKIDVRKDGVKFHNESMKNLSNAYELLLCDYRMEQSIVVREIFDLLCSMRAAVYSIGQQLSKLDVIIAFAIASIPSQCSLKPYVRPNILPKGSGILHIVEGRHPTMESICGALKFIANNTSLNKKGKFFQVITGPNMGGKSTYIRQVSLIVLMAHIGCFVPCDEATISIIDSIFARFGSRDYTTRGVSTFFAEMIEATYITQAASSHSLVLIDELGRGTSTYDGIGIASAMLEYLVVKVRCFGLFATHFHEIAEIYEENELKEPDSFLKAIDYLHMTANVSPITGLSMLYRLMPGICGHSFGIHVARLVKLPDDLIKYAEAKLLEFEDNQWNSVFVKDKEYCKDGISVEMQANICRNLIYKQMKDVNEEDYEGSQLAFKRALQSIEEHSDVPLGKKYVRHMMNIESNES